MSGITVKKINKSFSGHKHKKIEVLKNFSLNIKDKEFVAFFGPNGCGKSTLLQIIAGLEKADSGDILIGNKELNSVRIGFVFQNYNESMLPWRTVLGNVELALEAKIADKNKREEISKNLLKKVGLLKFKNHKLYQLSGGMKQLVSICRAFAYDPEVLLMDEPFSALDYLKAKKMELELLKIWNEKPITSLIVTHEVDEAIFLADKVVVLSKRPGKIKGTIKIKLPRPRNFEMLFSDKFSKYRKTILKMFENE